MFNLNTFDLNNIPKTDDNKIDFSKDFFGKPAHLTVSGQLNVETYAFAFRNDEDTISTHPVEIYCYTNSAGYKYAVENNAPAYIIDLNKEVDLFGDVDENGVLNTKDARKALNFAAGHIVNPTEDQLFAGDLNQNGHFDIEDARIILYKITKIN